MKTDLLDYELPSELVAQEPAAVRSDSRLLVLTRSTGTLVDSRFSCLADFLRPGDCLVLNDTKVLPARFFARRTTGGKLEGLFLHEVSPVMRSRSAAARPVSEGTSSRALGGTPKRSLSVFPVPREDTDKQVCPCHPSSQSPGSMAAQRSVPAESERANCGARVWEVMLKGARKVKPGESICIEDRTQRSFCTAQVLEKREDGVCLLAFEAQASAEAILNEVGFPPLPPYIRRDHDLTRAQSDQERYQTVYARHPGAVAAPTAGLHFTEELIGQLQAAGVGFAHVTLHVGAGTFKPIATEQVEEHEIHSEWYRLDAQNADLINAARRSGGRIVAVGTTATRVLETVAGIAAAKVDGVDDMDIVDKVDTPGVGAASTSSIKSTSSTKPILQACEGTTKLFITPGYAFQIVDAMITNFHLPRSTLLALVGAFAGLEKMLAAYHHAIEQRYRFYSYGDAMLIA